MSTATVQVIYDYAKLATLSYVDLSAPDVNWQDPSQVIDVAKIKALPGDAARIPEALGKQMLDPGSSADVTGRWTLLDPYFRFSPSTGHSDPDSGFAAMLVSNSTYGKVLAVAGTEPGGPGQFVADLLDSDVRQIGFWGVAFKQVVSLYNYVQVLRAPAGSVVQQLVVKEGSNPPSDRVSYEQEPGFYLWLDTTATDVGRGLIAPGEQLTVTGHSLGGHVAAVAVAMFPELFTHAYTYNAPGYDPPTTLGNLGVDEMLALFVPYGITPFAIGSIVSRVTTYESESAYPGDDGEGVASDGTGTPFSPEKYITTETVSHDVGHMMDGLAIQAFIARLDPSLDYLETGEIVTAASAITGESFENLVEVLHHLLKGAKIDLQNTTPGATAIDAGDFAKRSSYYDALIKLSNETVLQSLYGKLKLARKRGRARIVFHNTRLSRELTTHATSPAHSS